MDSNLPFFDPHYPANVVLPHGVNEASIGPVRQLLLEAHRSTLGSAGLGNFVVRPRRVPCQPESFRGGSGRAVKLLVAMGAWAL